MILRAAVTSKLKQGTEEHSLIGMKERAERILHLGNCFFLVYVPNSRKLMSVQIEIG